MWSVIITFILQSTYNSSVAASILSESASLESASGGSGSFSYSPSPPIVITREIQNYTSEALANTAASAISTSIGSQPGVTVCTAVTQKQ